MPSYPVSYRTPRPEVEWTGFQKAKTHSKGVNPMVAFTFTPGAVPGLVPWVDVPKIPHVPLPKPTPVLIPPHVPKPPGLPPIKPPKWGIRPPHPMELPGYIGQAMDLWYGSPGGSTKGPPAGWEKWKDCRPGWSEDEIGGPQQEYCWGQIFRPVYNGEDHATTLARDGFYPNGTQLYSIVAHYRRTSGTLPFDLVTTVSPSTLLPMPQLQPWHRVDPFGYSKVGYAEPLAEPGFEAAQEMPWPSKAPVFFPVAPGALPPGALPRPQTPGPVRGASFAPTPRIEFVAGPGPNIPPRYTNQPHVREPPGKNVKEKKANTMGPGARLISKIFHSITEVKDITDCLGENIKPPRGLHAGKWEDQKGMAAELQWIFDNAEHLDVVGFMQCVVENHFEDKLIGGLNAGAQNNLPRPGGIPVSGTWGPAF